MSNPQTSQLTSNEQWVLGLILVGVLILVLDLAGVHLFKRSSDAAKETYLVTSPSVLAYNTVDDAGNRAGYYPADAGREGMSMSGNEAPVWHQTAHDPNELDLVSFESAASRVEYSPESNAVRFNKYDPNTAVSKAKTAFDTVGQEGMSGFGRIRNGMSSMQTKLEASMNGRNITL